MLRKLLLVAFICLAFTKVAAADGPAPPWPMCAHDRQHTGRSPYVGPHAPKRLWAYAIPEGRVINFMSSIDADGTVYVGTWGWEDNAHGKLYAVRPDGSLKWVFDPGSPEQPSQGQFSIWGTIEASVAIDPLDGTLYFGRGDNKLYAIHPDGTLKWVFPTFPTQPERLPEKGGQVIGSPIQDNNGTIYFGTIPYTDEGVPALWAVNRDGTERWHVEAGKSIWSSPAIGSDGTVYFGSWDGKFYAVQDLGQGSYRLKTPFDPGDTYTNWFMTPAIGPDGTIYATATEVRGICQTRARLFALTDTGDTLVEKWSITAENDWESAFSLVIAADGTLFLGSGSANNHQNVCNPDDQGNLYRVTDNGPGVPPTVELLYEAGGAVGVSIIDAEGTVYFNIRGDLKAGRPGKVFAVHPDGSPAWPAPYQAAGEIWMGAPVLGANGVLYFGDVTCADVINIFPCDEAPALYALGDVPHDDEFSVDVGYTVKGFGATFADSGARGAKVEYKASEWNTIEPKAPISDTHTYDWTDLDAQVLDFQRYGFDPIHITLQSKSSWGTLLGCTLDKCKPSRPKPEHWSDYEDYVRAVVERYDGDGGPEDMPGLRYPVRFYEIETEADAFWEDTQDPNTYLQVLEAAARVAREAYPDVQILPGAMYFYGIFSGDPDQATLAARRAEQSTVDAILNFDATVLGRPDLYDTVEVHFMTDDYRESYPVVRWLRQQMQAVGAEKPIFLTDVNSAPWLVPLSYWDTLYPQETVQGYLDIVQSEAFSTTHSTEYEQIMTWYRAEQAEYTIKVLLTAMEQETAGVMFVSLGDFPWEFCIPRWYPGYYSFWGWGIQGMVDVTYGSFLLCVPTSQEPSAARPVFHTLRTAMDKLRGFHSVERLRPAIVSAAGALSGVRLRAIAAYQAGVYAYRVMVGARPVYVLWVEDGIGQVMGELEAQVTVRLPVATEALTVTHVVTASGQSQPAAEVVPVTEGAVRLTVREAPIFVEGDVMLCPLPGDFNCDDQVTASDITAAGGHWGQRLGDPDYSPHFDMDRDGDVDIVDVMRVSGRWGTH